jgi:hypothetical protein
MCVFWILKNSGFSGTMIEDPYGQYINTSAITAIIVKESSSRDN